jgi:hypothetical protein
MEGKLETGDRSAARTVFIVIGAAAAAAAAAVIVVVPVCQSFKFIQYVCHLN